MSNKKELTTSIMNVGDIISVHITPNITVRDCVKKYLSKRGFGGLRNDYDGDDACWCFVDKDTFLCR